MTDDLTNTDLDERDAVYGEEDSADSESPEYSFEGFTIEFNQKIALTPLYSPELALVKGTTGL